MEKNNWYEEFRHEPLPERLRSCRKHFGWSQEELEFQSNVPARTIRRIECKKINKPRTDTLSALEKALELPCGYLSQPCLNSFRSECLNKFLEKAYALSSKVTDDQFSNFIMKCIDLANKETDA